MQRRFFIYSTPRSGSAWLSTFLTYSGSYCQHEPLAKGPLVFAPYPVSGAVDTGASFIKYLPPEDVHVFSLYRDLDDVRESLRRISLPDYDFSNYKSSGFRYERINDIGYLEHMWDEITGLPFDRARAEALIEMNVQRDIRTLFLDYGERQWRGWQ